jgi:hypothetical protein
VRPVRRVDRLRDRRLTVAGFAKGPVLSQEELDRLLPKGTGWFVSRLGEIRQFNPGSLTGERYEWAVALLGPWTPVEIYHDTLDEFVREREEEAYARALSDVAESLKDTPLSLKMPANPFRRRT